MLSAWIEAVAALLAILLILVDDNELVACFFLKEIEGGIFFFWNFFEAPGGVREKEIKRWWTLLFGGTKLLDFCRTFLAFFEAGCKM